MFGRFWPVLFMVARLPRVIATDVALRVTQRARGVNHSSLDAGGNIPSVPSLSPANGVVRVDACRFIGHPYNVITL